MKVLHVLAGIAGAMIVAGATLGDRQLLYNDSPSVPLGFWYRTSTDDVRPGKVIAFRPPEPARQYVHDVLRRYLHDDLLKPVVAGEGDEFCVLDSGKVTLNGAAIAEARDADQHGRRLPHWRGCRRLAADEFAVMASLPNSFDSRYYGPVRGDEIRGTYAPLWTW